MRLRVIMIVLCLFLSPYLQGFNEEVLKEIAEAQGYGYKYANLNELRKLTASFNEENKKPIDEGNMLAVQVPDFIGISSARVIDALVQVDVDVAAGWAQVIEGYSFERALEEKRIPSDFWLQQEVFVKNLEQKFDQLDKDDPFNLDETALTALQELLHNVGADRLMVRSTGKEDTRTLANAGGNTSVPNVESTMEAVRNAAKEVVLSYFGRKSLEQRFGLGDKTLFDRDVFCPVLIQRMIGERQDDTTPPSCGVMFTEEPEGGISYKDEKDEDGRIKTTGITIIQAARGHNEGVVNSKVVVDTYVAQTIDDNPVFYPVIRHKHERLVPTPGAALRMVPNKPEIAVVSALNEATLTTLKKFADRLERHYSYPLDVEFVVRDNAVWIVQARPIVHKAELRTRRPSFIENLDELPLDVVSKGRTIVGFGGMITDIPDAQSVVIKDRIGAALDEYLHKRDRDKVKAVLSGSDAPATSHEATTFRGEGKPVLHLLDLVPSEAALNQDKKLALSPQQHCVVIVDKEKSIEKKEGWCAYPLPRELSVIPLLYAGIDPAWRPHVWRGKFDLKASLALMRDFEKADRAKVIEEAKVFPDKVFSWLNSRTKNVDLDVDLKVQIFSLLRATKVVCDRIGAMLNKADVTSLEVFLPINYLEALLYQQLDGEQELRYLSLARLGRTLLQEQQGTEADVLREKLVIKDPVAKRLHLQLQKADAIIFEERTQQAWSKLIDGLAHVDDNVTLQTVGKLTATLQSLDILPFWLHVSMAPSVTAFDPSVTSKALRGLVKTWVDGYQQHAKSFALIRRLRERVLSFNVDRFADPSQFNDAWKELLKAKVSFTVTSFTDMVFKDKTDEQLLLVAAVGVMQQFVDLFDRSIKAMKGSALWKKEEQSAQFKKMLAAYLSLLSMWCEKMTKQQKASLSANFTTVQSYLDMLAGIVGKNLFESKDLEPSQFAVAHFAMGAEHDFVKDSSSNTQKPATGEDAYTLIHQSLLNICSRLIAGGTVQDIKLPSLLQKIRDFVLTSFAPAAGERFQKAKLTGMRFEASGIKLMYNIPLGSHSLQIDLHFIKKTNDVVVALNFFGGMKEEAYRWANAAALACFCQATQLFDMKITALGFHVLSVEVLIQEKNVGNFEKFFKSLPALVKTDAVKKLSLSSLDSFFNNSQKNLDAKKCRHLIDLLNQFGETGVRAQFALLALFGDVQYTHLKDTTIAVAINAMNSPDILMNKRAIGFYKALIKERYGFSEAVAAAGEAMGKADADIKNMALDLYEILFEKGYGFAEAIVAARKSMERGDIGIALNLYEELIDKEYGLAEAATVVSKGMTSERMRRKVLQLYIALVEKGYGFTEAAAVASTEVKSEKSSVQELALALYNALIEKRQQSLVIESIKKLDQGVLDRVSGLKNILDSLEL